MWKPSKITGLSEKPCNLQMCLIEVKSGESRLDGRLIKSCRRKGGVVTEELPSPSQFLLCVLPQQKPAHIHGFADYKMKKQGSLLPALPPPPPAVIPEKVHAPQRSGSASDGRPSELSKRSKCAAKIPLESISLTLHVQDALRVLDIILRQQAANRVCVLAAQSFFCDNSRNLTEVGGGVTSCAELHYSFHPPYGGLSLYMDVTKTVILTPGGEVNFLIANQNIQDESHVDWDKVKVMLNMMFQTMPKEMEFKIIGLSEKPCNLQMCSLKVTSGDSRLGGGLTNCCRRKGVIIEWPHTLGEEDPQYRRSYSLIRVEKMIEQVTEELPSPSQFLLCVLPEQKHADIHGSWTKKSLSDVGIVYQCISPSVINDQYLWNMLLRMNTKIGGTNSLPLEMEVSRGSSGRSDVRLTLLGTDCESSMSVGTSQCKMGPRKDPIKGGFNFFGLMEEGFNFFGLMGGVVAVGCYVVRGGAGAWSAVADLRRLRSIAEPNFRLHGQFGLNNLGASCYANAAFQAFISLDSLKREILSIERSGVRLGRMTKVLREILYPRDGNTAVVNTAPIFNAFRGAKRNEVDSPSKFFDEMMQKVYREHPTVADLFGGRRESRRKFEYCEYKTLTVKTFKYIYLQGLEGMGESLSANLHNLFTNSGYIFDKFCDRCRTKHRCNILWKLIDPPQILIVETKFSEPELNNRVTFDESLSLRSSIFISKPRRVPRGAMEQNEMWNNPPVMGGYPPRRDAPSADASVRYQLKAIVHCTLQLEGNHFIAYVRRVVTLEDGRREVWWLKADDHRVTRTTMDEVLSLDTPVYFFYELIHE